MNSISTMRGDAGQTSLAGGIRVSKSAVRVEAYGTIDELNSTLGFARSICEDHEMVEFAKSVQRISSRSAPRWRRPAKSEASGADRSADGRASHRGSPSDRGDGGRLVGLVDLRRCTAAAAFDMARTICRRAER